MLQKIAFIILVALLASGISLALADQNLAKKSQNPIGNMISLPFQNNTDFNYGPDDETLNTLNIQPVWPFKISEDWNLITRTILPVVSQPGLTPGAGFGS